MINEAVLFSDFRTCGRALESKNIHRPRGMTALRRFRTSVQLSALAGLAGFAMDHTEAGEMVVDSLGVLRQSQIFAEGQGPRSGNIDPKLFDDAPRRRR